MTFNSKFWRVLLGFAIGYLVLYLAAFIWFRVEVDDYKRVEDLSDSSIFLLGSTDTYLRSLPASQLAKVHDRQDPRQYARHKLPSGRTPFVWTLIYDSLEVRHDRMDLYQTIGNNVIYSQNVLNDITPLNAKLQPLQ
ncbi:hypothetical protein [Bifidobacterium tibiigranuli]|uniref:hypothetical protein n=2 Tax=Bifidobacterium tibiigranuli TaxID=2172043 RepID=UPI0026EEB32B|nr:hypothetical protein [Bifidobacterium tibiigranuli]MCI1650121.1 hypothetical protein [Bifidobacterium tibiigranuli]MCI1714075.1 hypothetical protein [Bifidobacterium tibiigranuli]MCI1833464.1 hypothetical protein [Bifidobacterium tibiigranuli]MCI2185476.1 hypothetical protein [Bifidobacterium tibiigranuli]MCI2203549.1 hypothetical protein [Bifidobacterium tibiigranuli]